MGGSRPASDPLPDSIRSTPNAAHRKTTGGAGAVSWCVGTAVLRGPGRPGGAVEGTGSDVLGWDDVPHAATADAVDGGVVLVDDSITLELLVEGEHGTLAGWVDVPATSAAAEEDLGG